MEWIGRIIINNRYAELLMPSTYKQARIWQPPCKEAQMFISILAIGGNMVKFGLGVW